MRSVSSINKSKLSIFTFFVFGFLQVSAQQNSPFSRFGLGETVPSGHIISRGMAGITAAYADGQSVNFANPASYSRLNLAVTYDLGVSIDNRSLKSAAPISKYSTTNFTPSYVVLGMPLSRKHNLGLAFGLRPISTINYSITERRKVGNIDSITSLYQGTGGLNQAFVGVGKRWGGFSVGLNGGFYFGRKETSTRTFISDTVNSPSYNGNFATVTSFNHAFINGGIQYDANLNSKTQLRIGIAGNTNQKLSATQDVVRETFYYDANGTPVSLDSAYKILDKPGTINLPTSFTAGFFIVSSVEDKLKNKADRLMFGVEYQTTKWADYRFLGQNENLANSWNFRVGGQFTPNPLSATSYWSRVAYRAGVQIGKDQLVISGTQYPVMSGSIGAGFPIRKWRSYDNQFTNINTAFELGRKGNSTTNITESFFKFSVGVSLSDIWFVKRKYD